MSIQISRVPNFKEEKHRMDILSLVRVNFGTIHFNVQLLTKIKNSQDIAIITAWSQDFDFNFRAGLIRTRAINIAEGREEKALTQPSEVT